MNLTKERSKSKRFQLPLKSKLGTFPKKSASFAKHKKHLYIHFLPPQSLHWAIYKYNFFLKGLFFRAERKKDAVGLSCMHTRPLKQLENLWLKKLSFLSLFRLNDFKASRKKININKGFDKAYLFTPQNVQLKTLKTLKIQCNMFLLIKNLKTKLIRLRIKYYVVKCKMLSTYES